MNQTIDGEHKNTESTRVTDRDLACGKTHRGELENTQTLQEVPKENSPVVQTIDGELKNTESTRGTDIPRL